MNIFMYMLSVICVGIGIIEMNNDGILWLILGMCYAMFAILIEIRQKVVT